MRPKIIMGGTYSTIVTEDSGCKIYALHNVPKTKTLHLISESKSEDIVLEKFDDCTHSMIKNMVGDCDDVFKHVTNNGVVVTRKKYGTTSHNQGTYFVYVWKNGKYSEIVYNPLGHMSMGQFDRKLPITTPIAPPVARDILDYNDPEDLETVNFEIDGQSGKERWLAKSIDYGCIEN